MTAHPVTEARHRLLAAGDPGAWTALDAEFRSPLIGWVRGAFRLDPDDAEDVFQDSLLSAWRGIGAYTPDVPLGRWFIKIVKNEALSRLRYARNSKRDLWGQSSVEAGDLGHVLPGGAPGPEETALWRETLREAWHRVRAYDSPAAHRLFRAYVVHGDLPNEQMARVVGSPPTVLKQVSFRLRRRVAPGLDWAA
ncbi:MAG TPA: sigma-70 family RNA polymerase sigma factor [Actinomycetota bacterium]|nr:sigma-70 family RNA polymerase sigma factor [Actinomycetota bacterium]